MRIDQPPSVKSPSDKPSDSAAVTSAKEIMGYMISTAALALAAFGCAPAEPAKAPPTEVSIAPASNGEDPFKGQAPLGQLCEENKKICGIDDEKPKKSDKKNPPQKKLLLEEIKPYKPGSKVPAQPKPSTRNSLPPLPF